MSLPDIMNFQRLAVLSRLVLSFSSSNSPGHAGFAISRYKIESSTVVMPRARNMREAFSFISLRYEPDRFRPERQH
jgi:hypothetical protein